VRMWAFILMLALNGCIYMVVGGVGALGGYVISPDTVEGMIGGKDQAEVWEAVVDVVSVLGVIQEQSEASGILIARIQGTKVTIKIVPVGADAERMSVKARKAFLPKIRIAQEVYSKVEGALYKIDESGK
jgi:hypothetical protein